MKLKEFLELARLCDRDGYIDVGEHNVMLAEMAREQLEKCHEKMIARQAKEISARLAQRKGPGTGDARAS